MGYEQGKNRLRPGRHFNLHSGDSTLLLGYLRVDLPVSNGELTLAVGFKRESSSSSWVKLDFSWYSVCILADSGLDAPVMTCVAKADVENSAPDLGPIFIVD